MLRVQSLCRIYQYYDCMCHTSGSFSALKISCQVQFKISQVYLYIFGFETSTLSSRYLGEKKKIMMKQWKNRESFAKFSIIFPLIGKIDTCKIQLPTIRRKQHQQAIFLQLSLINQFDVVLLSRIEISGPKRNLLIDLLRDMF